MRGRYPAALFPFLLDGPGIVTPRVRTILRSVVAAFLVAIAATHLGPSRVRPLPKRLPPQLLVRTPTLRSGSTPSPASTIARAAATMGPPRPARISPKPTRAARAFIRRTGRRVPHSWPRPTRSQHPPRSLTCAPQILAPESGSTPAPVSTTVPGVATTVAPGVASTWRKPRREVRAIGPPMAGPAARVSC
jgi:hypothetical protein